MEKAVRWLKLTSHPNSGWLSHGTNVSECDWFSTAKLNGIEVCDTDQRTLNIALNDNNAMGTLPEELGLLTTLEGLKLERNKVGGPILTQLGALLNLQDFQVFVNKFTGTMPLELGALSNLMSFSVLRNNLEGSRTAIATLAALQNEMAQDFFCGSVGVLTLQCWGAHAPFANRHDVQESSHGNHPKLH